MKRWISSSLSVLLITIHASSGAVIDPNDQSCPGGIPRGTLVNSERVYHECRDRAMVIAGCLTEAFERVELDHATFASPDNGQLYKLQCRRNGDSAVLEPVACLHSGAERKIGEEWADGENYYCCSTYGQELKVITVGCIDQGQRVRVDEKVARGEFLMVCNKTGPVGARMMQIGCVKDGRPYLAGETFDDGKFSYNCMKTGGETVMVQRSGCVHAGRQYRDRESYVDNEVTYECNIDQGPRVLGCSQQNGPITITRRLGCNWLEGQPPFQYEWNCKHDEAANTAVKVQTCCNYNGPEAFLIVQPGCYKIFDKSTYGCVREGNGLRVLPFQGDKEATAAGLRAC